MKYNFPAFHRLPRPGEERRAEVVDRLQGKVSKYAAGYRLGDSSSNCGNCSHNLAPENPTSNCQKAAGTIYTDDQCNEWEARTGESPAQLLT